MRGSSTGRGADLAAKLTPSPPVRSVRACTAVVPAAEAIALTHYGGYTQRQVAAMTGTALGTVKSRIFTGQTAAGPARIIARRMADDEALG
ncbi:hypothetical protein HBB16_10135 [Pseudonocardia sp. MCCB 268]|nr:hypothetical protein [Pseudonocardia cytotoxica]